MFELLHIGPLFFTVILDPRQGHAIINPLGDHTSPEKIIDVNILIAWML
jgi:hypothetical protein